jgi:multidrug transporter EmrE-like cation transporter
MREAGILLSMVSGILFGLAIVFMRSGVVEVSFTGGPLKIIKDLATTRDVVISFSMSVLGYITSIIALKYGSAIVTGLTIAGFNYIALIAGSYILLGESLSIGRIMGAILIFIGVISINKF